MCHQIFIIWLLNKMQIGKVMIIWCGYFIVYLAKILQEI